MVSRPASAFSRSLPFFLKPSELLQDDFHVTVPSGVTQTTISWSIPGFVSGMSSPNMATVAVQQLGIVDRVKDKDELGFGDFGSLWNSEIK